MRILSRIQNHKKLNLRERKVPGHIDSNTSRLHDVLPGRTCAADSKILALHFGGYR
jgi:hypothetical protein